MRLSFAVQTHPRRAALAAELAIQIPGVELVFDPAPDDPVRSPWRTYREALARTPDWCTHRVVIQDDVELCENFVEAVHRVAAARPDNLVTLFVAAAPRDSARAFEAACSADERFAMLPHDRWVPAIALVWPTRIIAPLLDWVDRQRWPAQFRADDEILGKAMTGIGERTIACVPSLVEHPDDVESIAGSRPALRGLNLDRVAVCFIDGDPLELDWQ